MRGKTEGVEVDTVESVVEEVDDVLKVFVRTVVFLSMYDEQSKCRMGGELNGELTVIVQESVKVDER